MPVQSNIGAIGRESGAVRSGGIGVDMAALDDLPIELRLAIKKARFPYSCVTAARCLAEHGLEATIAKLKEFDERKALERGF